MNFQNEEKLVRVQGKKGARTRLFSGLRSENYSLSLSYEINLYQISTLSRADRLKFTSTKLQQEARLFFNDRSCGHNNKIDSHDDVPVGFPRALLLFPMKKQHTI